MQTFKLSIDLEELEFDKIKYCQCYEIIGSCLAFVRFWFWIVFTLFFKLDSIHYINRVYKVGELL